MDLKDDTAPSIAEVVNVKDIEDALRIQTKIQSLIRIPQDRSLRTALSSAHVIIALDIAYSTKSDLTVASGVVWDMKKEEIIYEKVSRGQVSFPYHPGLLAFREIPLLVDIIKDALSFVECSNGDGKEPVEVIILCDGAGIAHPRLCGIACHLGVLFDVPSIGVAKNHLAGEYNDTNLQSERGSYQDLKIQDQIVGSVLRSQIDIRPIFVSPGHQISVDRARNVVLQLCHRYRLPEPIRRADHIGRVELKRIEEQEQH